MEIIYMTIGTVIISIATSIITARWMMEKEIELLDQMYKERLDNTLKRSEEIVLDFLETNVHKFQ